MALVAIGGLNLNMGMLPIFFYAGASVIAVGFVLNIYKMGLQKKNPTLYTKSSLFTVIYALLVAFYVVIYRTYGLTLLTVLLLLAVTGFIVYLNLTIDVERKKGRKPKKPITKEFRSGI